METRYEQVTLEAEDRHWWYRGRRRILHAVVGALPLRDGARILDAGCGGGRNLAELARFGEVTGLEPSAEALAAARARGIGPVVEASIERMPFDDAAFDLAVALDVIEHLDDDVAALRELRRVARADGWLLVTVPAYPRLWGPHDMLNRHRRRYTRRRLIEAAARAGWSAHLVTHFNSFLLPVSGAHRLIQAARGRERIPRVSDFERTPRWLDPLLELPLRSEARLLRAGRRLPAGLSILAVFRPASQGDRGVAILRRST